MQIQIYFVTIPMVTGGDEGTILVIVIEPSPPPLSHQSLCYSICVLDEG